MKDFLKVAWINETSKFYWNHIIQEFKGAYNKLELESVGVSRSAAIIMVSPHELPDLSRDITSRGWSHVILSSVPDRQGYSNKTTKPDRNEPVLLRVLVSVKRITNFNDDYTLGRLLGYPICCIRDFKSWWGKMDDPTWRMYHEVGKQYIPTLAGIHYRQLGIRLVRHLPCTPHCRESNTLARSMFDELCHTIPSATIAVRKFLNLEAHWDRLHGIAEVKNEFVKFAYNTDYTPTKQEFTLVRGDHMVKFNEYEWKDNGFSTQAAMDRAHDPILITFLRGMKDVKSSNPKVIDYGCGNASLLEKMQIIYPRIVVHGIDTNEAALRNAEQRLPFGVFRLGNLFTNFFPGTFDFALVSVMRLIENPKLADSFINHLKNHTTYTIFYDYDNGGPVVEQLSKLGINVKPLNLFRNNACEAVLVRW